MQHRALLPLVALSLFGCVPDLDTDEATVTTPRVLAVIAEPPEVAPGPVQPVQYRALVADARGVRSDVPLTWFHCLAQKPLAELGPVSPDCFRVDSGRLAPFGQGGSVMATVPATACSLFGPNPPPPVEGQPPGRPVDPDESGGYKIPVMVGVASQDGDDVVLYEQRIACGLSGVSPALGLEYSQRYHANRNPAGRELRVVRASGESIVAQESAPIEVAVGERLELELAWTACPASDACGDGVCGPDESRQSCEADCARALGCDGAERYLDFDREGQVLRVRRESMRIAWYATAGKVERERTGVDETDLASASGNAWSAPAQPADVTLWMVLRDARGGVGVRQLAVRVR